VGHFSKLNNKKKAPNHCIFCKLNNIQNRIFRQLIRSLTSPPLHLTQSSIALTALVGHVHVCHFVASLLDLIRSGWWVRGFLPDRQRGLRIAFYMLLNKVVSLLFFPNLDATFDLIKVKSRLTFANFINIRFLKSMTRKNTL
jgi:hypothetical protein